MAHVPNRGYHSYQPSGRQEGEVAEIGILLETGVASRILTATAATDIVLLERLATKFIRLMADGVALKLYEANLASHYYLLQLCGNQELLLWRRKHARAAAPCRCISESPGRGLNNPLASTMR